MYKNKSILAVIPARGGSKGVPKKNIKNLAGKPLLAWTIEEAKKSRYIDRLILSSDSKEIIKIAKQWGCDVPFVRPSHLAGDDVPAIKPLIHAVKALPQRYDYTVLLQCTSPLKNTEDIDKAMQFCIDRNATSCISVCEAKGNPFHILAIDGRGRMKPFLKPRMLFCPRQKLPKVYEINGAFYMIKTGILLKTQSLIGKNTLAYIMSKENSLDIDQLMDFVIAETLIKLR